MSRPTRSEKILTVIVGLALLGVVAACDGASDPAPDSDSQQSYADGSKIPTDLTVYDIVGTVTGPVGSLTRQVEPAHGTIDAPYCVGTSGCYGGGGGTITGPIQAGKGFVRITVASSTPASEDAVKGSMILLKSTDTKVAALTVGDTVTFRCRRQYEAVAAVQDNEKFDAKRFGTWEFDFCRLATPLLTKPAA